MRTRKFGLAAARDLLERYDELIWDIRVLESEMECKPKAIARLIVGEGHKDGDRAQWRLFQSHVRGSIYPDV